MQSNHRPTVVNGIHPKSKTEVHMYLLSGAKGPRTSTERRAEATTIKSK